MAASQALHASASLYVGDLHKDATEAMLYEVFNAVGPVASIRVCRDSSTRRSLGYAYVNYHSVSDAERALDTLNYTHIRNVPCRLMWSHRDPSLRKSGAGNVFVKNLDKDIDNKALYDTFNLFGNILSCKVAQDASGKSRGFGFVHYETDKDARSAINSVNGMVIGSKTVFVGPFKKKSERGTQVDEKFTNIFVKNLPTAWDEAKVKEIFAKHGEVTSVAVKNDAKGRPFAFVNYADYNDAKTAVETLNNVELKDFGVDVKSEESVKKDEAEKDGEDEKKTESGDTSSDTAGEDPSRLYVQRFQSKVERTQMLKAKFDQSAELRQRKMGVNLYIKNIHDSVDEEGLRDLFVPFGTINSAKLVRDENGVSRGFGFVSFLTAEEATKAVTEMHLKLVEGKPLYVGLHEKREERKERLQQKLRPQTRPGPRMAAQGMPPVQFGAPPPMYYGGQPGGMPPGSQHMAAFGAQASGNHRVMPASFPGGQLGGGMMQPLWNRGGQPGQMRYGPGGSQGAVGPQVGLAAQGGIGGGGFAAPGGVLPGGGVQGGGASSMSMAAMPGGVAPGGMSHIMAANGPAAATGLANVSRSAAERMVGNQMSSSQQKQMIGERLFPRIAALQPTLAGKITGMMLDMDISELFMLLDSQTQLKLKVDEALRVLQQAGASIAAPMQNPAGGGAMGGAVGDAKVDLRE